MAAIVMVFLESEKIGGGRERCGFLERGEGEGGGGLAYVMLFEREKGGLFLG